MKDRFVKRICVLLAVLLICMVCFACSSTDIEEAPEGAIKIYCTDKGITQLNYEYYEPVNRIGEALLNEVLECLDKMPANELYTSAKPLQVKIISHSFGEDGQLILNFNAKYLEMDKITEIICRAGIIKTLTQLDGVDYIEFRVEDSPLLIGNQSAAGLMASSDFIDNTGGEVQFRQSVTINVYYADETGTMLTPSLLSVESTGVLTQEELAVRQLIAGPLESQPELRATIPAGTVLNNIMTRDGIAYVDLSPEFLNGTEGISNEAVVYSIVNTLADIPNINKVRFTINNESVRMYGDIVFNGLFERRPELITDEKAGEKTE